MFGANVQSFGQDFRKHHPLHPSYLSLQIERKKTEQKKQKIMNQVTEVTNNANNEAVKIKQLAETSAKATREEARNSGLQIIYSTLNVTNATHKRSLDYLRTLSNHKGVHLYVGYQTMIAKEGN